MSAMFKLPGGPQFMTAAALQAQGRPVPAELSASMFAPYKAAQPASTASSAPPAALAFARNRQPATSAASSRGTLAGGMTMPVYNAMTLGGGR